MPSRGRRVYASVPHAAPPMRWLDPLLLGTNAALYAAQAFIVPTSRVVFREPFLAPEERGRPIVYVTWHRLNYVSVPALMALPREERPTIIAHDGVASRAFSHHSAEWMGFEVFVFRRRSKVPPREQIAQYMRSSRRPILNLPDSGGPYGVVKPGILEVARACDALVVPFVVDAQRAVSIGKTLEHVLPLPFGRFDVRRGPALDGNASSGDLQSALDALAS